jgi:hypothetical protein
MKVLIEGGHTRFEDYKERKPGANTRLKGLQQNLIAGSTGQHMAGRNGLA